LKRNTAQVKREEGTRHVSVMSKELTLLRHNVKLHP